MLCRKLCSEIFRVGHPLPRKSLEQSKGNLSVHITDHDRNFGVTRLKESVRAHS